MPPPLPYFKVNIFPFPLPHFASIFFAYLWSFRWPNYIVTLPRYFSFRPPYLNIPTRSPLDELDKNIQQTSLGLFQQYFSYVMAVSFIGGGNRHTRRKTTDLSQVTAGFELTILVVIGTNCIGSYKSNYHTITTTTTPNILCNCR